MTKYIVYNAIKYTISLHNIFSSANDYNVLQKQSEWFGKAYFGRKGNNGDDNNTTENVLLSILNVEESSEMDISM